MASKKGRSDQADRAARVQQMQRDQRRKERRHAVLTYSVIAAVVLLLIGLATFGVIRTMASTSLAAVQSYKVTAKHVQTAVKYPQTPPAGGKHNPIWLNCATYSKAVPNENAVHSLEHGAVWVTYRPNLPAKQVATLEAAMPPTYAILSPFEKLKAPVVASAWGKQLALKSADDPRLKAFIRTYAQGAQAPESGAACTGGTDGTMPLNGGGGMPGPLSAPAQP